MELLKKILIAIIILLLCINYLQGSEVNQFIFNSSIYYYLDEENTLDFEQISSNVYNSSFIKNQANFLNFGFTKATIWLKFDIKNEGHTDKKYFVRISKSRIRDLEYFEKDGNYLLKHIKTGNANKFDTRQIPKPIFLFEVDVKKNASKTIFLKINNEGEFLKIPISLITAKQLYEEDSNTLNGIIYGILIMFMLLNLFYFLTFREATYLYFAGYVFSLCLYLLNNAGLLFQHLWSEFPIINKISGLLLITFASFSFLHFTKFYYQVKSVNKKLNDLYKYSYPIIGTIVLIIIFIGFGYKIKLLAVIFLVFVFISIGIITSIDRYYNGFKASIYYRISIFILLAGIVIQLYGHWFLLNSSPFQTYSLSFAFVLHLLFFNFGLSERNRQIKVETDKVAEDLEHLERERFDEILNQKEILIAQREELLSQKEELEVQQEQLQEYTNELEKLSLVAKETQNIVYVFDKEGNLEWFNESFSSLLGLPSYNKNDDSINIRDISFNNDIERILEQCIREKEPLVYDVVMETQDGEKKWYQTTISPVLDENKELQKIIAIDSDITTLKQYEKTVESQKQHVEGQKKEIMDSIRYASRIQESILPTAEYINRHLRDNFIIYLPKDIVSGDFYWYQKIDEKHIIVAVDCTGHGVPGAFMSIIGNYLLNNIILQNGITDPAEILKQLNRKIKITLKADPHDKNSSDGMDVSVVVFDEKSKHLEFSGALRPLIIVKDGELEKVNGDNQPISSDISNLALNKFTNHRFDIEEGDSIYLYTDGIIDQFGGDVGKKFLSKRFLSLLEEINHLSMEEQKHVIQNHFYEWKGGFEQVDDILIMGFRF